MYCRDECKFRKNALKTFFLAAEDIFFIKTTYYLDKIDNF